MHERIIAFANNRASGFDGSVVRTAFAALGQGFDTEFREMQSPEDSFAFNRAIYDEALAALRRDNPTVIVFAGGDGTFMRGCEALMRASKDAGIPLGDKVIAMNLMQGRYNLHNERFGIPANVDALVDALRNGGNKDIGYMEFTINGTDESGIGFAGVGFNAGPAFTRAYEAVREEGNGNIYKLWMKSILPGLKAVELTNTKIHSQGKEIYSGPIYFCEAVKSDRYTFFHITPDPGENKLKVIIIPGESRYTGGVKMVLALTMAAAGFHNNPIMRQIRVSEADFEFESSNGVLYHHDAEIGNGRVYLARVEVPTQRIKVRAPRALA